MGQRYKNLFSAIVADDNLREAYRLTALGKRQTLGYLAYKEESEVRIAQLRAALIAGTYRSAAPHEFWVYEPKARRISALPFADRVVQHALYRVIGPIFDRVLMGRCYACRVGRGVHRGVVAVQTELRQLIGAHGAEQVYFLKTDFAQYFASIDRAILWCEIERKISCWRTLDLIARFTPRTGIGLPIGNLTSQLWANVYGHIFDRWLVSQGALCWHRYMDDVVILGTDWRALATLLKRAEIFARETMGLRLSHWMVAHHTRGINFLGYRIFARYKLLRPASVRRARRKLRYFARHDQPAARGRFLSAWLGHAGWADSHNLLCSLSLRPVA